MKSTETGKHRWHIINALIREINAQKYLEIGFGKGINFNKIHCDYKIVASPNNKFLCAPYLPEGANVFAGSSDDFFKENIKKFDVIFIDGLHTAHQVRKDILNSLKFLNKDGYIICHDINPKKEIIQRPEPAGVGSWTGDCWKSWVRLREEREDLKMFTVDAESGCGIITRGSQATISTNKEYNDLCWEDLESNRMKWLNLISLEDFYNALRRT